MRNLKFKYFSAKNFFCFGPEGIEVDLEKLGNIVLIRGENLDVIDEEGKEGDERIAVNGIGKCFGIDTPILMYDGSIKRVQDVKVNDLIMGNDSKPRRVIKLSRGKERLYKIVPKKGGSYIVNASHVLTLKSSDKTKGFPKSKYKCGDVYNISVRDYLSQNKQFKHLLRGYRTGVCFNKKRIKIDPYFLGAWLGDGTANKTDITTADKEIRECIEKEAKHRNLKFKEYYKPNNKAATCSLRSKIRSEKFIGDDAFLAYKLHHKGLKYKEIIPKLKNNIPFYKSIKLRTSTVYRWIQYVSKWIDDGNTYRDIEESIIIPKHKMTNPGFRNSLYNDLKHYNLLNNKHIPNVYKHNSEYVRLEILAGLLDTDGYLSNGCFDFVNKNKTLVDDVVYICRSLGLAAYAHPCKKTCQNGFVGNYWRITISGDCSRIPVRLPRRKCDKRKQIKDPLIVGIKVESLGVGDYYGFTLEGNPLFLLGDFTVVHNSSLPECIFYTLFGKTIKNHKKIKHDNIVNNQTGNDLRTEVRWDKFRVVRTRNPTGLRMWESEGGIWDKDTETTLSGMQETQKLIDEKLGLNYETCLNLLVFADQNHCSFLECDNAQKRTIVEDLMALQIYGLYHEEAKEGKNEIKNKIKLMTADYERSLIELKASINRIDQINKEEQIWLEIRKKELVSLKQELIRKKESLENSDVGKLLAAYELTQINIQELSKQVEHWDEQLIKTREGLRLIEEKIDIRKKEKYEIELKIQEAEIKRQKANLEIKEKSKIIRIKDIQGQRCDQCFSIVSEENYSAFVSNAQKSIDNNNTIIKEMDNLLIELNASINNIKNKLTKANQAVVTGQLQEKDLISKINKTRKDIQELVAIQKPVVGEIEKGFLMEIAEVERQIDDKEQQIYGPTPYVGLFTSAQEDVKNKERESQDKKKQLQTIESDLPYYEWWSDGFSSKGIPKFAINDIIPTLNLQISHWLEFLIDGKIKLTFDNELEETIERNPSDGDPFVYYVMSGGERRRLNLAVSQAFAYIMMHSSKACPSVVFLDEVTTNIDPMGVVGVYNMILELAKDKQVFVTTHDQGLLELLQGCETLYLRKKGGFSKIVNKI